MITSFDFQPNTRIVFAPGSLTRLGELVQQLGGSHVFLVTDPGIVAAGHVEKAIVSLQENSQVTLYKGVRENPDSDNVEHATAIAREHKIDFIVALGGGSSMDCAKGVNFLLTNGGKMSDYWGVGKAQKPMLASIGIPTTTGTGSETQCFALITNSETHQKMACGDKKAAFKVALLDPDLTVSQSQFTTTVTGIDAISHALETAVTRRRNPISSMFSHRAWYLLARNFLKSLEKPDNIKVRAAMQIGACYAGMAIENSMLGATHSCANPLTKNYGIVHGVAIALMLPHVIRFNASAVGEIYAQLCWQADWGKPEKKEAGELLAQRVSQMVKESGLPNHLSECNVVKERLLDLAEEAESQWTAQFNPREISREDFLALYEAAW